MTIGQRIKQRREAVGLSQQELAGKVGVSYQALQQWELPENHKKHTSPRGKRIEKLAAALTNETIVTTPEYLIFGEEKNNRGEKTIHPPELEKLFSDIKSLAQENMRLLYVYVDMLLENQRLKTNRKITRKTLKH